MPSDSPSRPGEALERYELREKLAQGGMATIHRAYDRLGEREVAYKRVRPPDEESRARLSAFFQREFDTLARLEHPNIVQVFDFGFDEVGPFYTMELLSGEDLSKRAPVPFPEACRILRDIASALALLHTRSLVHRDLSPNNVRLTQDGRAKLIDFGALVPFGHAPEIVGTPPFVAPESILSGKLDQRTDLYSLGAVAYWLLTKKFAVRALSLDELPTALRAPVAPPSSHLPSLPPALDELLLSLLSLDPAARPAHAADVIERLERIGNLEAEADERVAYSYLKHTPLQGRAPLMALASKALDALSEGRGSLLWVDGKRGAGRSAALAHLAVSAELRGAIVLWASGGLARGEFGVVRHLLRAVARIYPERTALLRRIEASFARASAEGSAFAVAEAQAQISESVRNVFVEVAAKSAVVLLVDDAELADADSQALLASMVEAIHRSAVLLAFATGDGPPRSDAEVILRAESARASLPPLSAAEVEGLLDASIGAPANALTLARFLHAETGGNPAHCIDLLRFFIKRGLLRYLGGAFVIAPDITSAAGALRVVAAQHSRIAGLEPVAQTIRNVLCIEEGSLTIAQLSQWLRFTTGQVVAALVGLLERGIVVRAGDEYGLSSEALRRTVADALTLDEARACHLALARGRLAIDAPTLEDVFRAGLHLIRAGESERIEGAELILKRTRQSPLEAWRAERSVDYLEAALHVFEAQGASDVDCLDLLVPLSAAGFYGDLSVQRRYLDRTMNVLIELTGLAQAHELSRYLGPRAALMAAIAAASIRGRMQRSRRSVRQNITSLLNVAGAASGAATSAVDRDEAERVLRYIAPFRAAPEGSALRIFFDFCQAMVDFAHTRYEPALLRYRDLLARLEAPVPKLDDRSRMELRRACLNSVAQILVERRPARALEALTRLERESVFFAPHAEAARMGIHLLRGEIQLAESHRKKAEELALRSGLSWSVMVMITTRFVQGSVFSDYLRGLVRSITELERMVSLSPGMRATLELAEAALLLLRGFPAAAAERTHALLTSELGRALHAQFLAAVVHARALNGTERYAEAKETCEQALVRIDSCARDLLAATDALIEQLAIAHAGLGAFARATELLDAALQQALPTNNPLRIGSLFRGCVTVALQKRDSQLFEANIGAMAHWFQATANPGLIQQNDALVIAAERIGLRMKSLAAHGSVDDGDEVTMDDRTYVDRSAAVTVSHRTTSDADPPSRGEPPSGRRPRR